MKTLNPSNLQSAKDSNNLNQTKIPFWNQSVRLPSEKTRIISFHFSIFVLFAILWKGGCFNIGILIGLYSTNIDSYSLSPNDIWLLIPGELIIIGLYLCQIRKDYIYFHNIHDSVNSDNLSFISPINERKAIFKQQIMMILWLGTIGILTIWPSSIIGLYLVMIWVSIGSVSASNQLSD